jgi:hypothetical protein
MWVYRNTNSALPKLWTSLNGPIPYGVRSNLTWRWILYKDIVRMVNKALGNIASLSLSYTFFFHSKFNSSSIGVYVCVDLR